MIRPFDAVILGAVEGLTEFLPVSSTGHLILTTRLLGLEGEAVKAFEVVIQAGALVAVAGLYRRRIGDMLGGLAGKNPQGRKLFLQLLISFFPAVAAGLLLHKPIKTHLFSTWPVVLALAIGGVVMILADRKLKSLNGGFTRKLETLTNREALIIGLVQCLALWPGTSRAMVTLLAGMACGLSPVSAAEYTFLLALPTLGAAALFDSVKSGDVLVAHVGFPAMALGLLSAGVVAALAVHGFIRYLSRKGLAPFGWYRVALAAVVWWNFLR